ncbi:agmatinase [Dinoroseobacter sp. S375]|uniref:agmatinase n=1 Tax=Dinoroseobacter sp. S375 TaxID=3415136 RepID=UPI003C7DC930
MSDPFFHPVSGTELPRYAGAPSFMRLPVVTPDHPRFAEVEIGLIGTPWDGGTTNRPGARHGPRQIRDMSTMIRAQHGATGVAPFRLANCADLGDVAPNPAGLEDSMARITAFYRDIVAAGIRPLTGGGDHLCTLPILRALGAEGPLGLIQFDSHTDLFDTYFGGTKFTHGTPFRRAIEEGLIDPVRTVQIGIRGTAYGTEDRDYARDVGITIIPIEAFFERGIAHVMDEAREIVGAAPTYVTYDIDFVDPAFAPGTGTPEVGGPTSYQALQVARALRGLNIIGADLVEVAPPFDASGATAYLGASLMFEMLCHMAEGPL